MADVDQFDVLTVVSLEVVSVDERALGPQRVVGGQKFFDGSRVLYDFANLGPDEFCGSIVCSSIDPDILERPPEEPVPTLCPTGFICFLAFFSCCFQGQSFAELHWKARF